MPLGSLSASASQVPATLHSRISTWLSEQIASGRWPAHYRLKPEPELAARARGQPRDASARPVDAHRRGALVQVRGKGTFVTSTVVEPAIAQKLTEPLGGLRRSGRPLSTQVLECVTRRPTRARCRAARRSGRAADPAAGTVAEHCWGPVALLANFVRTDLAPGLETSTSRRDPLRDPRHAVRADIATGRRTFSATAADAETAALLEVPGGLAGAAPRAGHLPGVRLPDRVLRRLDPVRPAPRHFDPDPPLSRHRLAIDPLEALPATRRPS